MPTPVETFSIVIARADDGYDVELTYANAPNGPQSHRCELPPDFDDLRPEDGAASPAWRGQARGAPASDLAYMAPDMATLSQMGERLFATVFGERGTGVFQARLASALQTEPGRMQVRIDARGRDASVFRMPWEALRDPVEGRWLAIDTRTPLQRVLRSNMTARLRGPAAGPLRLLIAIANPDGDLDAESELRDLAARVARVEAGDQRLMVLDPIRAATRKELFRRIREDAPDIVHYIGHGSFADGQGWIHLHSDEDVHSVDRVAASDFSTQVLNDPPLLIVLNTCQGGTASDVDPFGGTAQALIREGVPAVVAMQFPISDEAALAFSDAFYWSLLKQEPVDVAVTRGRHAILSGAPLIQPEMITPVLYCAAQFDGVLLGPPSSTGQPPLERRARPGLPQPVPRSPPDRWIRLAPVVGAIGFIIAAAILTFGPVDESLNAQLSEPSSVEAAAGGHDALEAARSSGADGGSVEQGAGPRPVGPSPITSSSGGRRTASETPPTPDGGAVGGQNGPGDPNEAPPVVLPRPMSPPPVPPLSGSASPGTATYGSFRLDAGFTGDPVIFDLVAGGDVDASSFAGSCVGAVAAAPDVQLTYRAGGSPLIIRTQAAADTTLLVNGPDGRWYCDDDSGGGVNAQLRWAQPMSGTYDIWVGVYGGRTAPAELVITEIDLDGSSGAIPSPGPDIESGLASIRFEPGTTTIRDADRSVVQQQAARLILDPSRRAIIEGRIAMSEAVAERDGLALARASALRDVLISHGVPPDRLLIFGAGVPAPADLAGAGSARIVSISGDYALARIGTPGRLFFATGSIEPSMASIEALRSIGETLVAEPSLGVRITGHEDATAPVPHGLARARALAVRHALEERGARHSQLVVSPTVRAEARPSGTVLGVSLETVVVGAEAVDLRLESDLAPPGLDSVLDTLVSGLDGDPDSRIVLRPRLRAAESTPYNHALAHSWVVRIRQALRDRDVPADRILLAPPAVAEPASMNRAASGRGVELSLIGPVADLPRGDR